MSEKIKYLKNPDGSYSRWLYESNQVGSNLEAKKVIITNQVNKLKKYILPLDKEIVHLLVQIFQTQMPQDFFSNTKISWQEIIMKVISNMEEDLKAIDIVLQEEETI